VPARRLSVGLRQTARDICQRLRQNNDGPVLTATSQFDDLNRLTNMSAAGAETVNAYDNNGNLTSTKQNNQITAVYDYDARVVFRYCVAAAAN
jgi:hypothetical protein